MSRTFGHWTRILLCVFAVFVLVLAASACGDDDDSSSESETAETTAAQSDDTATFCDAMIDAETKLTSAGSPTNVDDTEVEAELQAALDSAPPSIADAVQSIVTMLREAVASPNEDAAFAILESPELTEADQRISDWMLDNCDTENIEVTASEYKFGGIPEETPAGPTAITLTNDGKENHMIAVFHINEGEDRPLDELLALPEAEAETVATSLAEVFVEPGQSSTTFARLDAGRYAAICFVSVGSVPGQPEPGPDAPPHFTQGMVAEFEVTG